MMKHAGRLLTCVMLLASLASCYLAPGKFTSSLDIGRDRSFTFTYVGEVIAPPDFDLPSSDKKDEGEGAVDEGTTAQPSGASMLKIATTTNEKLPTKPETPTRRAKLEALAATLSREYGFRSIRYVGNSHFAVDYAITGKLTHAFIFPFNVDGEVFIPFIAIELRGKDRVRIKAPGYAADNSKSSELAGGLGASSKSPAGELDGVFTLTTDAEIVSQNQENGATTLPGGKNRIVWTATPQTKDAPLAALKVDALP